MFRAMTLAGYVEAVGQNVTGLQPGDEVFGACQGACAEYACTAQEMFVPKPDSVTFQQAAAVPTSALAALHGLRNAGKVQPGQKVLINGAKKHRDSEASRKGKIWTRIRPGSWAPPN